MQCPDDLQTDPILYEIDDWYHELWAGQGQMGGAILMASTEQGVPGFQDSFAASRRARVNIAIMHKLRDASWETPLAPHKSMIDDGFANTHAASRGLNRLIIAPRAPSSFRQSSS